MRIKKVIENLAQLPKQMLRSAVDKTVSATHHPYRENEDLNRMLDELICSGQAGSKRFLEMGRDALRYIYGDQHFNKPLPKDKKKRRREPVLNQIYGDMTQEIALLTSNNPTITTQAWEGTDPEVAEKCGRVLRGNFAENNMRARIMQALYDDHIWGIKIAKTYLEPFAHWNPEKFEATGNGWEHAIRTRIINPCQFGVDPDLSSAFDFQTDARFCWSRRRVDIKYLMYRYPSYKKYLIEQGLFDPEKDVLYNSSGDQVGVPGGIYAGFAHANYEGMRETDVKSNGERELQQRLPDILMGNFPGSDYETEHSMNAQTSDQTVLVEEFFVRDISIETIEPEYAEIPFGEPGTEHIFKQDGDVRFFDRNKPTPNGGFEPHTGQWPQKEVKPARQKPKYPYGRVITRIDGKVIVQDHPWELERWPYSIAPGYMLPHNCFGVNAVEMVRGFQDYQNSFAAVLANYVQAFGSPREVAEENAFSDLMANSNGEIEIPRTPGSIIWVRKDKINSIKPLEPPQLNPAVFTGYQMFKDAQEDVTGVHDVSRGRAAQSEQTAREIMALDRNSRLRIAMQALPLDLFITDIAINTTVMMARFNKPGDYLRYVSDGPDEKRAVLVWDESMKRAKYDVQLKPGSTLPQDEEREVREYMMANDVLSKGGIMAKEIMEKLKIPNVEEILQRHQLLGPLHQLMDMADQMQLPHELIMKGVVASIQQLAMQLEQAEQQHSNTQ